MLHSFIGDFFVGKIKTIRNSIPIESTLESHKPRVGPTMAFRTDVTIEEITKSVTSMTNISCELDPMPTSLVKKAM